MGLMQTWCDYKNQRSAHTVVGDLLLLEGLYSPQLNNRRRLFVLLPPSYAADAERRYPVVYMHDGQNLFDHWISYAGEWQVDETMAALAVEGIEAIVVGIQNMGPRRIDEYSPFRDRRLRKGGRGDWYVTFVADTVKPLIDHDFRTRPEREHTTILGSSMGGLISLYAFFRRPEVFGLAGAMSPSLWFAQEAIFPYLQAAPFSAGRIYLDIGSYEGLDPHVPPRLSHKPIGRHVTTARRLRDQLAAKGYTPGRYLRYDEEDQAVHHESAWARRLPGALRWLLAAERRGGPGRALGGGGGGARAQPEQWWEF
ncbi:MAG: alpha/beta hydrolase [Kouleothrix sp.]|nr:alpha/beta hydrolase [Kouleothrix sp.]